MADIDIKLIKKLREMTGTGVVDAKKALQETEGDIDKAVTFLRKKGLASAAKRAGKTTAEGLVTSYVHMDRVGVLLEVNVETSFAANSDPFRELTHELAMQIAAMNPQWIRREDVSPEAIAKETEIATTQAKQAGKPDKVIEHIVKGRLEKFYEQFCLLDQPCIKDDSKTVDEMVKEVMASIGENIVVRRFARFEVGEGIEREEEDFGAEVRAQLNK